MPYTVVCKARCHPPPEDFPTESWPGGLPKESTELRTWDSDRIRQQIQQSQNGGMYRRSHATAKSNLFRPSPPPISPKKGLKVRIKGIQFSHERKPSTRNGARSIRNIIFASSSEGENGICHCSTHVQECNHRKRRNSPTEQSSKRKWNQIRL